MVIIGKPKIAVVAQIEQLQDDGVQAMVFVNTDGTVKAVCIGGTPSTAMTIQGTKTMVYPG